MKVLVTGSTGFVGIRLMRRLKQSVAVGRTLEKIRKRLGDVEARVWDPDRPVGPSLLAGVATIFHLAGESLFNGRWNSAKKEKISQAGYSFVFPTLREGLGDLLL